MEFRWPNAAGIPMGASKLNRRIVLCSVVDFDIRSASILMVALHALCVAVATLSECISYGST